MSLEKTFSFESTVSEYIEEKHLFCSNAHVLVAVSGGADSVALLLCLRALSKEKGYRLSCVHIHHGLRTESDAEATFVSNLCKENDIPFYMEKIDVKSAAESNHEGIEETARKLRYEVFAKVKETCHADVIATAHNANDVSETFLFHAFRGTGTEGLGSIPPKRDCYVRPFLCVTRNDIETYLLQKGQTYCNDASNDTDDYSRNRIRHAIIPVSKEINARSVEHMADASELVREMNEYVKRQADILYHDALIKEDTLVFSRKILSMSEDILVKMVVRKALETLASTKKDITKAHLDSVVDIIKKEGTRSVDLPYRIEVLAEHDRVLFAFQKEENLQSESFHIEGETGQIKTADDTVITWNVKGCDDVFSLPENECTKCWDYDKIEKPLVLRHPKEGDYLRIHKGESKKTLSNLLTDLKLPKADRKSLYVLANGSEVLWVVGVRRSETAYITQMTKKILYMEVSKEVSNGETSC